MARSRYNLIPAPIWPYLGPAFKGIDQDLSALEASGGGGTGGGVSSWNDLTDKPTLAAVATSGAYADLTGKPAIPDVTTLAPKASPTFTGTVTGVTKAMVGLGNVDNTADAAKTFTAAQTTSGVFNPARLGTGTRDGSRFLADDGTWKTPPTGDSGGVITSGPYTLDPKRAPADTVVLIPAGTTVLTHIGNRFTGQAAGTRPNADTLTLSGSLIPSAVSAVNWSYADTGYFGESVQLITPATATDTAAVTANITAGVKDMQLSYMLTYPAPTSDVTILGVYRTGGALTGAVAMKPGSTGGTFNLIYDDPKTAGSWNYTSPDVPTGTRIRIAIAVSIGTTGTDGRIKFLSYRVANDGTETQIGTMYEVTGQSFASTDVLTQVNVGKLAGKASMESATINIESMRIAYGAGAYDIGLLRSEQSYPAAI